MEGKNWLQWVADFVISLALRKRTNYCFFGIDRIELFRQQMRWVMFRSGD